MGSLSPWVASIRLMQSRWEQWPGETTHCPFPASVSYFSYLSPHALNSSWIQLEQMI